MNWMEKAGLTRSAKKDILDEAEKWWEKMGRRLVRPDLNLKQDPPKVLTGGKPAGSMPLPNMVSRAPIEADLNDGILRALPWDDLKPEEQAKVMFQYFSNIWLPNHPEVKLQRRVH